MVAILTPIYEAEFLGLSYGFRPKRNQHQALDALAFGVGKKRINWVLDCDVQSFFDKVSREWLIRFLEHRIGDRRIVRLICKWLTAGVIEEGRLIETDERTPQRARDCRVCTWSNPSPRASHLDCVKALGSTCSSGACRNWVRRLVPGEPVSAQDV